MLRRGGWRERLYSLTTCCLFSLDSCIPPLIVWAQTLGRGLDCNTLTEPVLPPALLYIHHACLPPLWCYLFLTEEGMRVPHYIRGVQQGFQGVRVDQSSATSSRAAPAASVTDMSCGSNSFSLGNGDVRESQLEGILTRRAPD